MPDWTAFGAVAGLVLLLMLGLARATTAALSGDGSPGRHSEPDAERRDPGAGRADRTGDVRSESDGERVARAAERESVPTADAEAESTATADAAPEAASDAAPEAAPDAAPEAVSDAAPAVDAPAGQSSAADREGPTAPAGERVLPSVSSTALLGNVVVTHGVLAAVLVGAASMTDVPFAAFGLGPGPSSTGLPAVAGGVVLGLLLAGANVAVAANLERVGLEYSEALRTSLAPDSAGGWGLLFVGTLPLVALFEELLFRGVLIGVAAAATGLSPWWFVVPSSALFAAGHGLQGRGGVAVTGLLGGVLSAAFALTGSLLLVVVAHYVVNAVEFALHELLGLDPRAWLAV